MPVQASAASVAAPATPSASASAPASPSTPAPAAATAPATPSQAPAATAAPGTTTSTPSTPTPPTTEPATPATPAPVAADGDTPADLQAIFTAHPDLRAHWDKHFTQKSQALADQTRQIEANRAFIQSFQTDPRAAVIDLARQLDIPLAAPTAAAPSQLEAARVQLVEMFGEDEAARLLPIIKQVSEATVAERVTPLEEARQAEVREARAAQALGELDAFKAANPDWQKYEPAMLALQSKILPGEGMSEREYLDVLYRHAAYDDRVSAQAAEIVAQNARAAAASAASTPGTPIPSSRVTAAPPSGRATFRDAAEAAKRGEVWYPEGGARR